MLSNQDSQLVAAFFDDKLGLRRRKSAERLLRRSSEARTLLQKMQEDSDALRQLPSHKPPPDLTQRVLQTIVERGLRPDAAPAPIAAPAVPIKSLPTWLGLSLAASVFVMVTAASFLYVRGRVSDYSVPVAEQRGAPELPVLQSKPPRTNPLVNEVIAGTVDSFAVPVAPGVHVVLNELSTPAGRTAFLRELQKESAHHLHLQTDVPARQAISRLTVAFKEISINLMIDPGADARLKKQQPEVIYLVYVENLLPEEMSRILQRFGSGVKTKAKKSETVVLSALTPDHRQHLATLLGVPVGELQLAKQFLNKKGPDPRDIIGFGKDGKALLPPAPKRFALVLVHDGSAPISNVTRQFLSSRGRVRPGTLQVCLMVHEAGL